MLIIRRTAENIIHCVLRGRNIPEARWPELVKKTGRGCVLLGVATVVPLLIADDIPLPVTIAMQVCYASLVCLGVILAFDSKKSSGPSSH